jgi:tripartite-type tricarboxylate transporter receptor subunit TctC
MKVLKTLAGTLIGVAFATLAAAQAYPHKPVKIIVAYPAGQGTDVATRYFAEQLSRAMGQPFIVENKPGAGGNLGTEQAARSAPDGYTLTMGTSATHGVNQFLYTSINFDAEKDFEPIILTGTFPMVISANPTVPANNLQELLALSKTPKAADIAMPSTTARLVVEFLKDRTKAPLFGVPYKGSGTAMTEVIGGQIPFTVDTVTASRSQVEGGKIKAIAVTSLKPSALLPGVKTVAEQGVPDFEVIAWNALFAPKGTPKEIIDRLSAEMQKIIAQPETKQKLLALGFENAGGTPQQLAEFARAERRKWAPLIAAAGIKAE